MYYGRWNESWNALRRACVDMPQDLPTSCGEPNRLASSLAGSSSELCHRYQAIEAKVGTVVLPFAQLTDFTDHGLGHAHGVQRKLSLLIPDELEASFTPFELFALLCATLLHDVGMAMTRVAHEDSASVRLDHYNRSRRFVIDNRDALALTEHEARLIGEICRSHGMPNLDYLDVQSFSIEERGEVRLRLLCALLRLADILDVTKARAPDIVARGRVLAKSSRLHWALQRAISDVKIRTAPSWDLIIVAVTDTPSVETSLFDLRNAIQQELDIIYPVLRTAGMYFKRVDLELSKTMADRDRVALKNPFRLLAPFGSREAALFAGRESESQQMLEHIVGQPLVVLIGESGVGKTSLVDAGVIPKLRDLRFGWIRFSFQSDAVGSLVKELRADLIKGRPKESSISVAAKNTNDILELSQLWLESKKKKKRLNRLLLIGDHLEQMFTVYEDDRARARFVEQVSRVLGSSEPVTFLFCIREDYLPDLFSLARDIPELYERSNTVRLHRLSRENGISAFQRASQLARRKLAPKLIERIVGELCEEGDGMLYPPYLQIVGHGLYTASSHDNSLDITETQYERLGQAEKMINRYLEGLLDEFAVEDKPLVGRILREMVTDYYTKKRVKLVDLQSHLPECHNLEKLLRSLVQKRIVRRSLGEYELIHDFLAKRVLVLLDRRTFVTPPVRRAMEFIDKNCQDSDVTSSTIASTVGITAAHLASLFRIQTGGSLNQHLNASRIGKAKQLLGQTREPVGDVARRCGFRSLSVFSRKFKEVVGINALEFRKITSRRLQRAS